MHAVVRDRPFDVDRECEISFDASDQNEQPVQLIRREAGFLAAMVMPLDQRAIRLQPATELLRPDLVIDDLATELVEHPMVGRHLAGDHGFTLPPVRIDHRLVVIVVERIERKRDAGHVTHHLGLDHNRHARRREIDPTCELVGDHALREH